MWWCRRVHARVAAGLAAALPVLLLSGCATGSPSSDGRVRVVASLFPLADVARAVGGRGVAVTDLTPAGAEPHDLELRPRDLRRLREANLVLYIGGGFQPAIEDAIENLDGRDVTAVDVLETVPAKSPGGRADPHVWLDPSLMAAITGDVAGRLSAIAPGGAAEFRRRAAGHRARLRALDAAYAATIRTCARRRLFTSHAAFGYLRRYGLHEIAIAGSSPEAEPTPRRIQRVVEVARRARPTTIFYERSLGRRLAETVARAVGARTALLDPIETTSGGSGDYASAMTANLRTIAKALECRFQAPESPA